MSKKFYLTTPLYYVNSKPHIGHSYTNIAADVLARYRRMTGERVLFLTGTDEHGQKIDRAARDAGMPPKEFTDKISLTFSDLWKTLNISHDDFIRTTEERHIKAVQQVWEKIKDVSVKVGNKEEKALYLHTYDGWYCVSCETFITEGLLDPNNPTACPDCKKPLERMKEDAYFFRMSAYRDRLIKDIREGKLKILPESRRNEVLGFLDNNILQDLCVSRPKNRLSWGIPVPFNREHVTYVWFDALINYISACGYPDLKKMEDAWPADVHIIGKDIIRHHAVIWPTLLYALDIALPKMIFAHGWWLQGGDKMSKSLGNVTDPVQLVAKYGVDAYRYFLLREATFGQDGTFSEEALITRCNSDLANGLGNLLSRSLTMCEKYFAGQIPKIDIFNDYFKGKNATEAQKDPEINNNQKSIIALSLDLVRCSEEDLRRRLDHAMGNLAFSESLDAIWILVNKANEYIEINAPWALAKQGKQKELELAIYSLMETLRVIAYAVWPFMPEKSEDIWKQLGLQGKPSDLSAKEAVWGHFKNGGTIAKGAVLFPRIETEKNPTK